MRDFDLPGRSPVHATQAMAATSHPLATGAALDVLKAGGNALDAAIAAVATLCVVEPQSTGIGGDCFVLLAPGGRDEVIGFNGSGRSPAAATLDWFLSRGHERIEQHSPHSVTVPGAIDAWYRLHKDHGRLDFASLLAPAIRYAEGGYPVHARVRHDWLESAGLLALDPATAAIFLPGGKVPAEGDLHRQPRLAETLKAIARGGRKAFYEGPVAQAMVKRLAAAGGLHTLADFAEAAGEYVTPVTTDYRGHRLHMIPPNNQGLTALIMFNILEGYELGKYGPLSAERTHLELEAGRLAYAARDRWLAERSAMPVTTEQLLSKDWAAELRAKISLDRAMSDIPDLGLTTSDTVYLSVVDGERNAVSFINSVYHSFGSGITCPETGVVFQNRGQSFRLDPKHPNRMAPRKRPMHTIMPGMLTKDGRCLAPYGVMGGDYQPFGHVRLVTSMLDYGMDPQAGLDLPRVFGRGLYTEVEKTLPAATLRGLLDRGHRLTLADSPLGGGQCIRIDHARGLLTGGSDPRKDGLALGY
jgi:gamma-glutamyltranspeptidase/glutathione hydrolase